ncbi:MULTISPECIES: hypothetical protein [Leptolyngbya]|uniref:hypothetical protein n=1 Tax=Leptolyngbya TaxID=47251 RepID=UPI00168997AA|nr:hypothetical protein [Leptolyngbya sp. FACHB-1624]MBD1857655.1 hypothetical protein [Leptolyngbya sp. FACHB-1624]
MPSNLVDELMSQETEKSTLAKLGQDFLAAYLGQIQIQTSENNTLIPNEVSSKVVQALKSESKEIGNIHYIATAPLQPSELEGFFFVIVYDLPTPPLS